MPLQQQQNMENGNMTRRKCGRLHSIGSLSAVAYSTYQKPAQPIPAHCLRLGPISSSTRTFSKLHLKNKGLKNEKEIAVAGDRTRVARVTGVNTYHYTTTTWLIMA